MWSDTSFFDVLAEGKGGGGLPPLSPNPLPPQLIKPTYNILIDRGSGGHSSPLDRGELLLTYRPSRSRMEQYDSSFCSKAPYCSAIVKPSPAGCRALSSNMFYIPLNFCGLVISLSVTPYHLSTVWDTSLSRIGWCGTAGNTTHHIQTDKLPLACPQNM